MTNNNILIIINTDDTDNTDLIEKELSNMKRTYQVIILFLMTILLVSCGGEPRGAKKYETYIPENIIEIEMKHTRRRYRNKNSTIREDFVKTVKIDDEYRIESFKGILSNLRYKKTYNKLNKDGFNEKIYIKVYYNDNDVLEEITYILYNYGGFYSYLEIDNKIIYSTNYRLLNLIIGIFELPEDDIYE